MVCTGTSLPGVASSQPQSSDIPLSPDKFPSSVAFDAINSALTASEADKKDAIKQGNAVFAFTLKNKAGETESWHIDLKQSGTVGTGLGNKPTGMRQRYSPLQQEYYGNTAATFEAI